MYLKKFTIFTLLVFVFLPRISFAEVGSSENYVLDVVDMTGVSFHAVSDNYETTAIIDENFVNSSLSYDLCGGMPNEIWGCRDVDSILIPPISDVDGPVAGGREDEIEAEETKIDDINVEEDVDDSGDSEGVDDSKGSEDLEGLEGLEGDDFVEIGHKEGVIDFYDENEGVFILEKGAVKEEKYLRGGAGRGGAGRGEIEVYRCSQTACYGLAKNLQLSPAPPPSYTKSTSNLHFSALSQNIPEILLQTLLILIVSLTILLTKTIKSKKEK